jgi:hypothetical protein
MDIWRYSDWWGLGKEVRNSQKHIYHWRDWITESLNDDVGYDQMVRLMLAADELAPESLSDQRATGLLARNYFLFNRTSWMDSLIEHTSKAFLGLTFNCAKCHDHKYDPISQSDYYRYRALFEPYQIRTDLVPGTLDTEINGIPRAFDCDADAPTYLHIRGDEKRPRKDRPLGPGLPALLAPEGLAITPVPLPILAHTPGLRPHVVATYRQQAEQKLSEIRRKASNGKLSADVAQKSLAAAEHAIATLMARYEAQRAQWQAGPEDDAESLAMRAAKFEKQQAILEAEQALAESEADWLKAKADNKKEFDEKITMAKKNLETARKAAENPGKTFTPLIGAVKTKASNVESDASRNKPFPTTSTGRRSALAQWLTEPSNPLTARVAVNHIWMRHFGTPLVPTVFDFGRKGTPPTHPELLDWLACEFTAQGWSMKKLHRLIVTSAAYRRTSSPLGADAATLATDGNNRLLWRMNPIRMQSQVVRDSLLHLAGKLDPAMGGPPIPLSESDRSQRRSLYFVHSHNDQHKFLGTFDDANVLECYRRDESIVPQQALALANSSLALSMARTINERLHQDVDQLTDDEFVTKAFQTVLSCSPTASERATALKALSELKTIAQNAKIGDITSRARAIVVQALVNHNDFVTVR